MREGIRIPAICIGAFFGYVLPNAIVLWLIDSVYGASNAQDAFDSDGYALAMVCVHFAGPTLGGLVAARIARTQPLLHGLLTALVGWLLSTVMGNGILAGFLYVAASLSGARLSRGWNAH